MLRDFAKYNFNIVDELFQSENGKSFSKTVYITFLDENDIEKACLKLGHIPAEDIYNIIDQHDTNSQLNLDNCFIENFSISEYKTSRKYRKDKQIEINNFSACNSIFYADDIIDFSHLQFGDNQVSFENSIFLSKVNFEFTNFGNGDLNFEYTLFENGNVCFANTFFGDGEISFKNAIFKDGRKAFERAEFGVGNKQFLNIEFGNGEVDFAYCNFNDGNISFKVTRFGNERTDFNHAKFGKGDVTFEKAAFGIGEASFRSAIFGDGKIDFTRSIFGKGQVNFTNTEFGDGSVSFVDTDFSIGKVSFKLAIFGEGKIDFHFAKFGKGDVIFDRSILGDGLVDFRTVDFSDGKVNFFRSSFGKGDVIFEASRAKKAKFNFKRTFFGDGTLNFAMLECGDCEMIFDDVDFGHKSITFQQSKIGILSLQACHINNYFDLRVIKCNYIDLTNSIVRDIVDITPHDYNVDIGHLDLSGMRLLGRIYIDWHANNVKHFIHQQNTNYRNKSEQFRVLKENYFNIGQYSDEDEAYVEFKRTEAKANYTEAIAVARIKRLERNSMSKAKFINRTIAYRQKIEDSINETIPKNILKILIFNFSKLLNIVGYFLSKVRNSIISFFCYFWASATHSFQWFIFDKIGSYATNPVRVLISMWFVYIMFTVSYIVLPLFMDTAIISSLFDETDPADMAKVLSPISKAFYHSAITFLTIGYGDYYPEGIIRWISSFEGFIGLFLMAYFTVAFVRKILR